MYQWDWPTPAFGGKFGAVHGLDVAAYVPRSSRWGDMARVADELSSTWVAFRAHRRSEQLEDPAVAHSTTRRSARR
jgi:para-nitrobenzyl esterase